MAHQHNIKSWLIFPVLNNPVFYYRYPESHPVHRLEESFSFPNWFAPLCPSNENYRDYFAKSVSRLITRLPVDVVMLDYLRTPYFWEQWGNEIDENQWPPYCYCDLCKRKFEEKYQTHVSESNRQDWLDWQGLGLSTWLEQIKQQISTIQPNTKVGIQILPLLSKNKRELHSEWVGQNLQNLQHHADFFSPLIYEKLLDWEHDDVLYLLVELLAKQKLSVVPSFQVSSIKWDRKTENENNFGDLIRRIQPLGIKDATVFHARDLLTEKTIRSKLALKYSR
jgi:uncharacterized lipoprotein YddW (UPF0748 family)